MLIQSLLVILLIGLLVSGPSFGSRWANIAAYSSIIAGVIFAFIYSGKLSAGITDLFLGGSGGEKRNEALAEAKRCETEKNYPAALSLYQKAIAKDRKNPAIRLQAANLCFRLRKYDLCIRHMRETLDVCRKMPMSERCVLMNRMADIYLQYGKNPNAATEILSRIITEFPDSKYAAYARERIGGMN